MSFDATLVIMAAGMGSRFGGLKQLEPVGKNGEVILDYSVHDAIEAGFTKIVFVIKHEIEKDFKELVGNRIAKKIEVDYVFQETAKLPEGYVCPEDRTKPWGTGHAILCCRGIVTTPFAVINADDYYGKGAYKKIYESLKNDADCYCMVGFRLVNTLTENGHVSRGVCEIENGKLLGVTERTKIQNCQYTEDDVNWIDLAPDTIVSMNMWGFTTDIFDYLERDFRAFLDKNLTTPKAEFYLPFVVDGLIKDRTKQVNVLSSEDKWYGVTYLEDKDAVVKAIREMTDNGLYDGI